MTEPSNKVPMYKGKPIPERFAGGFSVEVVPEGEPRIDKWALIAKRKRELDLEAKAQAEAARDAEADQASRPIEQVA